MEKENYSYLLKDLPSGPLDPYRNLGSFDWKEMKCFIENPDMMKMKNLLWEIIETNDFFNHSNITASADEQKRIASRHANGLRQIYLDSEKLLGPNKSRAWTTYPILYAYSPGGAMKLGAGYGLFCKTIQGTGTEKHDKIIKDIEEGTHFASYALTEVGHGSNAGGMGTLAKFDPSTQEFVFNTPNFESAKCWMGNLGKTCTISCVYARLITPDNQDHGVHPFVLPVRDPETLFTYPGVKIGDIGEKIGLNGMDNGFMVFKDYRVHRDCLLNKFIDVTPEGEIFYPKMPSAAENPLSVLPAGRLSIMTLGLMYFCKAVPIAIRYSAVRKQSGPRNEPEWPIIEYPAQQMRVLPHLANAYVVWNCVGELADLANYFYFGGDSVQTIDAGQELHAISSAGKSITSWLARDAIQDCREACGGHGYLRASGFSDIKQSQASNVTYEGENMVLLQQASNWMLKVWQQHLKKKTVKLPFNSFSYVNKAEQILSTKFQPKSAMDITTPETIMSTYKWLTLFLLKSTFEKREKEIAKTKSNYVARSNIQIYYANPLVWAYFEHYMLQLFLEKINKSKCPKIREVLLKLFTLFGLKSLEKHLGSLYEGGYISGPEYPGYVKEVIPELLASLKNEAVSLADAMAPPDFILNSCLGQADGEVYKHLEEVFLANPGVFDRPSWWSEVVNSDLHVPKISLPTSSLPSKL